MSEWSLPTNVEATSIERTGGFVWESGVYQTNIKLAYLDQSKGGAVSFTVVLENSSGSELKESFWIKSGNAKGNKTYYEKNGKAYPLPGYSTANSLCIAATGKLLPECLEKVEKKTIKIYDYEEKKELPKERPVVTSVLGKTIQVAVSQLLEDKTSKGDDGNYHPTGESRSTNECKFFGNATGMSSEEITSKAEKAVALDKWAKSNTGKVINKTTKDTKPLTSAGVFSGGDSTTDATPASLFG